VLGSSIKIIPSNLDLANLPTDYVFFLTTLGYERRARHIAETLRPQAKKCLVWKFTDRQTLNYTDNANWFSLNGYEIIDDQDDNRFCEWLKSTLTNASDASNVIGCVDISSMTRKRLATIVELCCDEHLKSSFSIDFLYSLGAYSSPSTQTAFNTHFSPISPFFAGCTVDPNKPPIAIVGLGYEEGKALGATEYIQADEAWVFIPESSINEYLTSVREANSILLSFLPDKQIICYRVEDPIGCYNLLESLIYGIVPLGRPIILPFGPKIFTLMALLACAKYSEASVWRVSAQQSEEPIDRLPSEHIIGVRVMFNH
jgi:hypothetical protein